MPSAILFLENYIAGGSDRVARLLIDHLPFNKLYLFVKRANDTSILLANPLPRHVELIFYNLVTIAELASFANRRRNVITRFLAKVLSLSLRYPLTTFSIFYFYIKIKKYAPDIFIANNGGYPGGDYCRSATIAAGLFPKMRVFHIVHSLAHAPRKALAAPEYAYDLLTDQSCQFIAVCQAVADQLKQVRKVQQIPTVIYNGLEPAAIKENPLKEYPDRNKLTLLHVGYFDRNKNQAMLLEAMEQVVRCAVEHVHVRFVGKEVEPGLLDELKRLTARLGLENYITFHDFQASLQAFYEEADVLVLCSKVEGFPMVILEAMRIGLPIIATRVGGVIEQVIDGENGFLVDTDDAQALADRICLVAQNAQQLAPLGRESYRLFNEKFTLEHMIRRYCEELGIEPKAKGID